MTPAQLSLEGLLPRARRTDPDTSHAAADSVHDLRASQAAVLWVLTLLGGRATDEQIADAYTPDYPRRPQQSPSGLRTRRRDLVDRGVVRDSGERVRLRTGRQAIVWEVTP